MRGLNPVVCLSSNATYKQLEWTVARAAEQPLLEQLVRVAKDAHFSSIKYKSCPPPLDPLLLLSWAGPHCTALTGSKLWRAVVAESTDM
jgi:hypothetical protein